MSTHSSAQARPETPHASNSSLTTQSAMLSDVGRRRSSMTGPSIRAHERSSVTLWKLMIHTLLNSSAASRRVKASFTILAILTSSTAGTKTRQIAVLESELLVNKDARNPISTERCSAGSTTLGTAYSAIGSGGY